MMSSCSTSSISVGLSGSTGLTSTKPGHIKGSGNGYQEAGGGRRSQEAHRGQVRARRAPPRLPEGGVITAFRRRMGEVASTAAWSRYPLVLALRSCDRGNMDPLTSGPAGGLTYQLDQFLGGRSPRFPAAGKRSCNAAISWQDRRAVLAGHSRKELGEIRWTVSVGRGRDLFVAPSPQEPDP